MTMYNESGYIFTARITGDFSVKRELLLKLDIIRSPREPSQVVQKYNLSVVPWGTAYTVNTQRHNRVLREMYAWLRKKLQTLLT